MNINRKNLKIFTLWLTILNSFSLFLYLVLSTTSAFAQNQFVTITEVNNVLKPRDWLAPSVSGIVNLKIDSVDRLDVKVGTSIQIKGQLTVDGQPSGPIFTSTPFTTTWDSTQYAEGPHSLSIQIFESPTEYNYAPFPIVVVADNIPGPVTGPQTLPICPGWQELDGLISKEASPTCDRVTFPGTLPTGIGHPRIPQMGIPFSTVLPDEDLYQETIMNTTSLNRLNYRFLRTADNHVVAMGFKQRKHQDYRISKVRARVLPQTDGPRNVGWVDPYIVGAVHPGRESLIFVTLADRVGEVTLDGTIKTFAGKRLKANTVPFLHNDFDVTTAQWDSQFELVGNFVDGPQGFDTSTDVAIDPRNHDILYVADSLHHRIARVDTSTTPATITTYVGSLTGQNGYQDGVGTQALFNEPVSLVMTNTGILYVADRINNLIRRVDSNRNVSTLVGQGAPGWPNPTTFELDRHSAVTNRETYMVNGSFSQASMVHPMVIRLDSQNNLIVGQDMTNTIRKVNPATQQVTLIKDDLPAGGAREWVWLDVDREGTVGPQDDIIWAASIGGSPSNEQLYRISSDGLSTTFFNTGLRSRDTHEGTFNFPVLPHYPWMVVIGKGAIWLSGYGSDGIVRIRKKLPTDYTEIFQPDYNIHFRNGRQVYKTGTVANFPWGSRPSFALLHGHTGWNQLFTSPNFDDLAGVSDAQLGTMIQAGWGGSVPRPEITGKDLRDVIYYIRRNSLPGIQAHVRPGPSPSDTIAPVIQNVSVTEATGNQVTVTWQTSEPTLGVVKYGTNAVQYDRWSAIEGAYSTTHNRTIGPLTPGQNTHYVLVVRDTAGNQTLTNDSVFTLSGGGGPIDSTPPSTPGGLHFQ
jgi:sugar lactone lactonase YvrE